MSRTKPKREKCNCRCHLPLVTTDLCPWCFDGCKPKPKPTNQSMTKPKRETPNKAGESKQQVGKVIIQQYEYKPYTNYRCAGCRKILVHLENGSIFQSNIPIVCCGKIRLYDH